MLGSIRRANVPRRLAVVSVSLGAQLTEATMGEWSDAIDEGYIDPLTHTFTTTRQLSGPCVNSTEALDR